MKKLILAATVVAIAAMSAQTVKAGNNGWNTAGQVLAGVAVGAAIVSIANNSGGNYAVSYSYSSVPACPPPVTVVCAPAPVVYVPQPVVYAPRPVVYAPAPVVVHRPVVYAPAVMVYKSQKPWGHGNGHYRGRDRDDDRRGDGRGRGQQYARR